MITNNSLLSPAQLSVPPDIDSSRPLCSCGAIPHFPLVGMHGNGLTSRFVPWPVLDDRGVLAIDWVVAVGRRFLCPVCSTTVRVAHAGLRRGARFGVAIIAALLQLVAAVPFGQGQSHVDAHQLVHERPLPPSELARSGRPRWSSLRRWTHDLARIWPTVVLPVGDVHSRLDSLLVAFGLGAPLNEVLDAAVSTHARGGPAM